MAAPEFASAEPVINLHRRVVERLSHQVWLAYESQGRETGGLLLGKVDHQAHLVEIQDFDPLLCEDRPDHQFLLSDAERSALEKRLAARESIDDGQLKVVGCYRSQIGEGLSLSDEDLAFARACYRDPTGVFLLIRPCSSGELSAGFFFWASGQIDSAYTFQEFPFDTWRLADAVGARSRAGASSRAGTAEPRASGEIAPSAPAASRPPVVEELFRDRPAAEASPAVQPAEPQQRHPLEALLKHVGKWRDRVRPVAARAFALCRRTSVAIFKACDQFRRKHAVRLQWRPLVAVLAVILSVPAYRVYRSRTATSPDAAALALQVERRDKDLRVSWNRDTPAVSHASKGVLLIRDGDSPPRELPLDLEQLRNGSVVYSPISTSVQFRLEVMEPNKTKTAETVFALAAKAQPKRELAAGNRQPAPLRSADRKPVAPPARKAGFPVEAAQAHVPAAATGARSRAPALLSKPAVPKAAPAARQVAQQPGADGAKATTGPAPVATPGKPDQTANASAFVAARPIRETRPNLTEYVRSTVTSAVEVQLKVQIDDSGRVVKADPVALSGPATESLVAATQDAARLWRFVPAKRGNQPIASEVVLKFSYRP